MVCNVIVGGEIMFKNLGTLISIVLDFPAFWTALTTLVKEVETTGAAGKDKSAAVIAGIDQFATTLGYDITPFNNLIQALIDMIVAVYNALGIFKHTHTNTTTTK